MDHVRSEYASLIALLDKPFSVASEDLDAVVGKTRLREDHEDHDGRRFAAADNCDDFGSYLARKRQGEGKPGELQLQSRSECGVTPSSVRSSSSSSSSADKFSDQFSNRLRNLTQAQSSLCEQLQLKLSTLKKDRVEEAPSSSECMLVGGNRGIHKGSEDHHDGESSDNNDDDDDDDDDDDAQFDTSSISRLPPEMHEPNATTSLGDDKGNNVNHAAVQHITNNLNNKQKLLEGSFSKSSSSTKKRMDEAEAHYEQPSKDDVDVLSDIRQGLDAIKMLNAAPPSLSSASGPPQAQEPPAPIKSFYNPMFSSSRATSKQKSFELYESVASSLYSDDFETYESSDGEKTSGEECQDSTIDTHGRRKQKMKRQQQEQQHQRKEVLKWSKKEFPEEKNYLDAWAANEKYKSHTGSTREHHAARGKKAPPKKENEHIETCRAAWAGSSPARRGRNANNDDQTVSKAGSLRDSTQLIVAERILRLAKLRREKCNGIIGK